MLRPEVLKELDRLLADPDYRRQAAAGIRPSSFYDKLLVAATDQSALVLDKALAAGVFKHVASISDATVPQWARLGAINALGTWCHGEGYTCAHNPSFELPQPVFAAAWKPGLVACIRCTGSRKAQTLTGPAMAPADGSSTGSDLRRFNSLRSRGPLGHAPTAK